MYRLLSQKDIHWVNRKLGASWLTVGRFGCTTTAVSMVSDHFGEFIDPGVLSSNQQLYTRGGLLIWSEINNIFKTFRFTKRLRGYIKKEVMIGLSDPNEMVLLQVAYGRHWVLADKMEEQDIKVADPWLGDYGYALRRYWQMNGSAHFRRKE